MNGKNSFTKYLTLFVLLMLLGAAAIISSLVLTDVFAEPLFKNIVLIAGIVLAVFGLLCLLVAVAEKSKIKKARSQEQSDNEQPIPVVLPQDRSLRGNEEVSQAEEADESKVRYIPSENVYQFVHMGDRQSVEEKFNEISKMDKTQFVIYVARLFSRKGYQVKFTPVIDNYDVDLLVEKMGVTIAVGCVLTTKILGEKDIRCILEGSNRYPVSNVMALTNMYFDRTALDFAKRERMSLVDRNILAEDFMK